MATERGIHIETHRLMGGIYVLHHCAVMYIPSFLKIGSGIQELIGGIHRQHEDRISLHSFFQNKESRQKIITENVLTPESEVVPKKHIADLGTRCR
jgi:hypothetical protein